MTKKWTKLRVAVREALDSKRAATDEQRIAYEKFLYADKLHEGNKLIKKAKDTAGNFSQRTTIDEFKLFNSKKATAELETKAKVCGGGPRKEPSAPLATKARPRPEEEQKEKLEGPWPEMQLVKDMPLYIEATREPAGHLDPNEEPTTAAGYHFCRLEEARGIVQKLYKHHLNPILLILPKLREDKGEVKSMKDALAKWEADTRKENISFRPKLESASILTTNPKALDPTGQRSLSCHFLHLDADNRIVTAHKLATGTSHSGAGPLPEPVANLTFQPRSTTDIQVAVIEPICKELTMDAWFKELNNDADKNLGKLKDRLKTLVNPMSKLPQLNPRVKRDRNLRWRGEEFPQGRIAAYFTVPNEHVEEYLAKSGTHGAIIDLPGAEEMSTFNYAKVKMPNDMTMSQVLEKVKALPPALRSQARGVVPTYKGYAVRVPQALEKEMTQNLSPELATELGQALGMKTSSAWKVHGIPRHVTKAQIHEVLARRTNTWAGWIVKPIKTLSSARNGKVTWLVEAASEPPKKTVTVNSEDVVCIEQHFDKTKVSHRIAPWFNTPKQTEDTPKSLWDPPAEEKKETPVYNMDVDVPANPTPPPADSPMQELPVAKKRERDPQASSVGDSENDTTSQLLNFMREQAAQAQKDAAQKDLHISELLKRIEQLSTEVASLRTELYRAQTQAITKKEDEDM